MEQSDDDNNMHLVDSNPCKYNRRSSQDDDEIFFHPGPIQLVYGTEKPILLADITRHILSTKKRRRNIDHLSFMGCQFSESTRTVFKTLGKKLRRSKAKVREFSISGIPEIGNEEILSLAPFLNSSKLLSLDLTGAAFNITAIKGIRNFFGRNTLLELNLGDNPCLGDDGVQLIISSSLQIGNGASRGKKKNNKLQVLALENCGIGHMGVSSISTLLTQGTSLRVLELSNNMIGDVGAKVLAASIEDIPLTTLGLNNTGIGDMGAGAFGHVLKSNNRYLHTLSLQGNEGITKVGAFSLLEAVYNTSSIKTIVDSNHTLKNLNMRGCSGIDSNLVKLASQLSARGRLLSTQNAVIRFKVTTYLSQKAEFGIALEDFDIELMPHILSFVSKSNGMSSLFNTLKSMPQLFKQYSPQGGEAISLNKEKQPLHTNNLFKLPSTSKRLRKYYARYAFQIPKHHSMPQNQGRGVRTKRENFFFSSKNNSKSSPSDRSSMSTTRDLLS